MRAVLLSCLLATSGCALLYDFADGGGGGGGDTRGASTTDATRASGVTTTDVSVAADSAVAATTGGSEPCLVGGDALRAPDKLVEYTEGSLAAMNDGVLAFGRRASMQPIEILSHSEDLVLSAATTSLTDYSRVAAASPGRAFMSGPPSLAVQGCAVDAGNLACAVMNAVGGGDAVVDVAWGGGTGAEELVVTLRRGSEVVRIYRTLVATGTSALLTTFAVSASSPSTRLVLFDSDAGGPADALFVRYGPTVVRCQLDADGCISSTLQLLTDATMRDATPRLVDTGREMYFIDGAGDVMLSKVDDERAPFLQGVDAHVLSSNGGRVYFDALAGSETWIASCPAENAVSFAACSCIRSPSPGDRIQRIAASDDGTHVYFTTKDAELYRWSLP